VWSKCQTAKVGVSVGVGVGVGVVVIVVAVVVMVGVGDGSMAREFGGGMARDLRWAAFSFACGKSTE
jgi:hypothetical protein